VFHRCFSVLSLLHLFLLSSPIVAAVDYSRCQNFLHPNSFNGGAGIGFGMSPIFGFTIKDDGSIQKADFADIKTEDGGKTQIITYELPGIPYSYPSGSEVKSEPLKMQYTIKRDDKGRIIEVYDGGGATTAQLEKLKQMQDEYYRANTPEEVQKRLNETMGGEDKKYEPPFMSYKGHSIKFRFSSDKCVPVQVSAESYLEPKADGATLRNTQLDIDLCRDVNEFLKANPEASACFRKDINERMGMIFKKHAPKFEGEASGLMGLGSGFGGFGNYGGYGSLGYGGYGIGGGLAFSSPAMLVMGSDETFLKGFNDEGYLELKRRMGNSPVINGQRLLQSCFDHGVRDIIEEDELWNQARANQGGSSPSSQDAQAR
jgi:hypothetical protein